MVTIQLNWTTNRKHWGMYLDSLSVQQAEVAKFLGVSDVTMSNLVKKMTEQKGLGASEIDKTRWNRAVKYVEMRADETKEASK